MLDYCVLGIFDPTTNYFWVKQLSPVEERTHWRIFFEVEDEIELPGSWQEITEEKMHYSFGNIIGPFKFPKGARFFIQNFQTNPNYCWDCHEKRCFKYRCDNCDIPVCHKTSIRIQGGFVCEKCQHHYVWHKRMKLYVPIDDVEMGIFLPEEVEF